MTNGSHKVSPTKKKQGKRKPTPARTKAEKMVPKSLRALAR